MCNKSSNLREVLIVCHNQDTLSRTNFLQNLVRSRTRVRCATESPEQRESLVACRKSIHPISFKSFSRDQCRAVPLYHIYIRVLEFQAQFLAFIVVQLLIPFSSFVKIPGSFKAGFVHALMNIPAKQSVPRGYRFLSRISMKYPSARRKESENIREQEKNRGCSCLQF